MFSVYNINSLIKCWIFFLFCFCFWTWFHLVWFFLSSFKYVSLLAEKARIVNLTLSHHFSCYCWWCCFGLIMFSFIWIMIYIYIEFSFFFSLLSLWLSIKIEFDFKSVNYLHWFISLLFSVFNINFFREYFEWILIIIQKKISLQRNVCWTFYIWNQNRFSSFWNFSEMVCYTNLKFTIDFEIFRTIVKLRSFFIKFVW